MKSRMQREINDFKKRVPLETARDGYDVVFFIPVCVNMADMDRTARGDAPPTHRKGNHWVLVLLNVEPSGGLVMVMDPNNHGSTIHVLHEMFSVLLTHPAICAMLRPPQLFPDENPDLEPEPFKFMFPKKAHSRTDLCGHYVLTYIEEIMRYNIAQWAAALDRTDKFNDSVVSPERTREFVDQRIADFG